MVTLPDITQGQMIWNTALTLIMQAAARSTLGRYPGRHLRGTLGLSTRGPIRSGHGGLHNTLHHNCQAQLLGQILPLDTWILGLVCLFACINPDYTKQEHKRRTCLTSSKHALWQTTKAS